MASGQRRTRLDRRMFLQGTAALLPATLTAMGELALADDARQTGQGEEAGYPGVIVRQSKPENYEFPFPTLHSVLTPNNQFYIRTHFGIYRNIDVRSWRLRIDGRVDRPLELSYDELRQMPSRTQTALLECSGNSRVFVTPKVEGVPWELGAVSNAEWTGVPLAAVLERAGLKSDAVDVMCEGADSGELPGNREEPKTPGKIHFARSLPLDKARKPEVLLAYKMNGADLPVAHGFPVRLLVPGWYGMASVKWVQRIIVTDRPFQGFFQTMVYSYYERRQGIPTPVPTTEIQVKSEIARPVRAEVVRAGSSYRVHGAAWTGESEITKVDVSTDGGKTWASAKLLDKSIRYGWRLWEHPWSVPEKAGSYTVVARATDKRGHVQPTKRDPDRRNGIINQLLPIRMHVR